MDAREMNDALVSFKMQFTDEQKAARKMCHQSTIGVLQGKPGTAKTTVSASVALELLMRKTKETSEDPRKHGKYDKIIITRPIEDVGKRIGFLPGDLNSKIEPYTAPVIEVMIDLIGKEVIHGLIEKGKIITMPIQVVRGRTFSDSIILLDESQNATMSDFKALASRLGRGSKMFVTSDWRQIDLFNKEKSMSKWLDKILQLEGVENFELEYNWRSPLAQLIMEIE